MRAPERVRRPHVTWVVDVITGREHAVTDTAYDLAMATNALTYAALCKFDVSPAPMVQAPAGRCRACAGFAAALRHEQGDEYRLRVAQQPPRPDGWLRRRFAHPHRAA